EKETVEVCSGLVFGVQRVESEGDCWKWREEEYSVKEAYQLLIEDKEEEEEEEEDQDWYKEVWNQLIPSNMSTLAWRLFYKRLPTKENLIKRGVVLNSSVLCVGGCGGIESEDHLFFNCPMMGSVWRELVRWVGIPVVLAEGGPAHLSIWLNF
ncbi:cytochrome P450, partial [Trifolium medium]|nr:cytochrome P450 [Trifolium medium]